MLINPNYDPTAVHSLTTATPTNLTGFIKGNGSVLSTDTTAYHSGVLTSGRVPYASGAATLTDSANLTFDGTNFGISAAAAPQQKLTIGGGNSIGVEMLADNLVSVTPATSGGSMADGTYYYVITSLDGVGETIKGNERSATIVGGGGAGKVTVVISKAAVGAQSYKIYRSTTAGVYTTPSYITQLFSFSSATYVDTAASPSAGAPPVVTTAYVSKISGVGASWYYGGQLTILNNAPGSGTLQLGNSASSQYATLVFSDSGNNSLVISTLYNSTSNIIDINPGNVNVARFTRLNGLQLTGPATVSSTLGVTGLTTATGGLSLPAGANIALATTTGTKIGTATNQLLGFYNATPVVQQTGVAAQKINYTAGDLDTEAEIITALNTTNTAINVLRTALNNLGLTTAV